MPYQNEPSESAPERTDKSRGVVFSPSYPQKRTFCTVRDIDLLWLDRAGRTLASGTPKKKLEFSSVVFRQIASSLRSILSEFALSLFDFGRRRYGIRSMHLFPETRPRFSYGNKIRRFWISIFADAKRKTCRASTIVAQKANDPSSLFGPTRCSLLSIVIPG